MFALVVIWTFIVTVVVAAVAPSECMWAAKRAMNRVVALAVRISGREHWTATVRTAQDEGSAGILPAVGFLAAAVGLWCWARRVMIARLLRGSAVLWFAGASAAAFLGHLPAASDPQMRWGGAVISVGMAAVMLAELLDPKITARRPRPQVVELSASIGAVGSLNARPTFHSDVMERLAEGAYYTSSTRRRLLP